MDGESFRNLWETDNEKVENPFQKKKLSGVLGYGKTEKDERSKVRGRKSA